ncbi:MAG TPA: MFS transporter, partial [Kofleriaceae bacterium]|nr:MFS transporter [Kofleriaceae bacterium]
MSLRRTFREYRALDRRIWTMAAVRAVNTGGLSLAMAFMAIYLVTDRGLSAQVYGWIYLAANLGQSVAQGYAGELSDRLGRRQIMALSLVVRAAVIAAIGAEILVDASLWLIAPTLLASAVLRGAFEPVAYALVADIARPEQRVAAYGLQRMGTNLGWAVGPAVGGLLAAVIHFGYVFFIAAAFLVIAGWVCARIEDPARHQPHGDTRVSVRQGLAEAFARRDLTLLLLCSFLFAVVHVQLFSTLSIYASSELHLTKADLGVVYAINGAAVLLLQVPAVGYIGRAGAPRALVFGSLLYVSAFLALGLADSGLHVALAVVLLTSGEVVAAPAHQAAAAVLGDARRMGRAFGLLGLAQMLGVAVAPLLGGVLYDYLRQQPLAMWGILGGVALVMAVAFQRLGGWLRR